jgi:hypothetical protein
MIVQYAHGRKSELCLQREQGPRRLLVDSEGLSQTRELVVLVLLLVPFALGLLIL